MTEVKPNYNYSINFRVLQPRFIGVLKVVKFFFYNPWLVLTLVENLGILEQTVNK
jgi:hypothetical protein